MKILISHVYSSHNAGDAAILSAQISELRRVFDRPQLSVLSVDRLKPNYQFDGVPVFNALMYGAVSPSNHKLKKLLLAWAMMSYTILWAVTFRLAKLSLPLPRAWRHPMHLLVEADMQVCVGGGYLRAKQDHTSSVILLLLFHQIWLAKLLNKPVYLYAQSFGPYPKRLQRQIAAWGLKKADLLLVREAQSKVLLAKLGVADDSVMQVADSAFLFNPPDENLRQLAHIRRPIVGITVRAWLPGPAQKRYEQAMADLIDNLSQDYAVAVIAQVTSRLQNDDDRLVGRRIKALLQRPDKVIFLEDSLTHYQLKAIFSHLDYLVGTRFHSVIFGLTARVPAIAIEYEHKTSGIMQDLDLSQWVISMEAVTASKLTELFHQLEEQRDYYIKHLQATLPAYTATAAQAGQLIKQSYERLSAADAGDPE